MNKQPVKHDPIALGTKKTFILNKSTKMSISVTKKKQKPMFEEKYNLHPNMMYMIGFYDRFAKPCTIVRDTERIFVVDQSPFEILKFSIKQVGYNLKGAMETSKEANGGKMCPIMVNLLQKLVIFPTGSVKNVETMWLNPNQIQRTYGAKFLHRKTKVEFKNGHVISVDSRLSSFNDKLKRAEQYRDTTIAAAQHSFSFILNPKGGKLFLSLLLALKYIPDIIEVIS